MELEDWKMTYEEKISSQMELLMSRHDLAEAEMSSLASVNAQLLGHANPRQKIKYVDSMKKENLKLKREVLELQSSTHSQKTQLAKLRRDLESLRPVPSTGGLELSWPLRAKVAKNARVDSSNIVGEYEDDSFAVLQNGF